MYDHGLALRPVVIAPEKDGAVFVLCADGGAAKLPGLNIAFHPVKPVGQKRYQILRYFAVAGSAALGEEVIKAVVSAKLHDVQAVLQLFNAVRRFDKAAEKPPAACGKNDQPYSEDAADPLDNRFRILFHFLPPSPDTRPKDGYESVSTCCLDFLGFGENYSPDGSMMHRMQTLAAIYVPLDGMNEKGLVVADLMAGDKEATHQDTEKPDLTTTAIRLLLDKAADVDEAIALLGQYDMNSSIGAAHHFSIADASGKSVVVEYVDGEMLVTETKVVTNHYLSDCEKQGVGSEQSHIRFDTLFAYSGPADELAVRDLLESVAQKNYPQTEGGYEKTMWSIVYCPLGRCADFYFAENYEHHYGLLLLEKGGFLKR